MSKLEKTMDGNSAAAYISYAFTEIAAIYPISPSSPMAEETDEMSAKGVKNIFDKEVKVIEMQSESGAAGAMHGSLSAGSLTTTYTASQGLLLMVPNLYKISGELLPGVFHVAARAIATHALSIFGDHSDVYACRQTGVAILSANNAQEIIHLGAVAHLSAIKGSIPFIHFFDGYRTSHEIQKVKLLDYNDLKTLVDYDALSRFKKFSLSPETPCLKGSAQNPDIYFQSREVSNKFYMELPNIVQRYMDKINALANTNYKIFNYYGAQDADRIIVAMGSVCGTIEEVVDHLNSQGQRVGLLKVRLFRPFSIKHLYNSFPKTVKSMAVLDRTKEAGSLGEPLYLDCAAAALELGLNLKIVGGRYGLAAKDVTPEQILAVYKNITQSEPKNHFTIGIEDDVTKLSLPIIERVDLTARDAVSCKIWGLGSDGTVGANKNSIKIIGDNTDLYVQAYFSYDSKKSGGITQSHLRFGSTSIRSAYLVEKADFVACHNQSYIYKYDIVEDLKPGGTFLLNCSFTEEELENKLTNDMKMYIAKNDIKLYTIDASKITKEIGLGNRTNTALQAAFFKLTNIIDIDLAITYMKKAILDTYHKKGEQILNMNYKAVDEGVKGLKYITIPKSWADLVSNESSKPIIDEPEYITNILRPINANRGDKLPVSAFIGMEDGRIPAGTAAYEKRAIAMQIPKWIPENCIQCNQCAYVCPHATIRSFLATDNEKQKAPEGFTTIKAVGKNMNGLYFNIRIDPFDCTGCTNCAVACPAKQKALVMVDVDEESYKEMDNFNYALTLTRKENNDKLKNVKSSQFEQPLLEFSGACAGCGETPYAKLVTQLYGDRMFIANATGCSSIWGGSSPSNPYTVNHEGKGPAWANSLFEDNAEFGFGIHMANKQQRLGLIGKILKLIGKIEDDKGLISVLKAWIDTVDNGEASRGTSKDMLNSLMTFSAQGEVKELVEEILSLKKHFIKKSTWIFGGDGWAYDIGFGGLDHVIASGEDINILVFDTEVYSNTGGQASKSTQLGAMAKFASTGMRMAKKDLGLMAMSYGYVYVASVAMGANSAQTLKAFAEAERYKGPSIIIAYSPCIAHGIKSGGMSATQLQEKLAVDSGYLNLYRFNPELAKKGKNPLVIDSKDPSRDLKDFMDSEMRFSSLKLILPHVSDELIEQAEKYSRRRLELYKKLSE